MTGRPDVAAVRAGLKDFQKLSADYAYKRLYEDGASRFLIADEVGLGKTLVAKAVVARAVDQLWDTTDRIDVVYVCSNAEIARQNMSRLHLGGDRPVQVASRLTLLPLQARDPEARGKLRFFAFSPGTSFDLGSKGGVMYERALLLCLVEQAWGNLGVPGLNVFQGAAGVQGWRGHVEWFHREEAARVDKDLARAFLTELARTPELRARFDDLREPFGRARESIPPEQRVARSGLLGDLRRLLARVCLRELRPRLVLLDEFQRFKDLLDGDDEVARLAQELFSVDGAKVLLLSATPYRMYTMRHEDENHYQDFVRTVRFLANGDDQAATAVDTALKAYRRALSRLDGNQQALLTAKRQVEAALRTVMCRTERLGLTADRNGLVHETKTRAAALTPEEVRAHMAIDELARALGAGDPLELWKAAPYLPSFMDKEHYALKRLLVAALQDASSEGDEVREILRQRGAPLGLPWERIDRYEPIDPPNGRLRALRAHALEAGDAWRLLWIPPALTYYRPATGPYADAARTAQTKTLVFSAWHVVPKAIASLLSYDAERRMVTQSRSGVSYKDLSKAQPRLLRFAKQEGKNRGMPVLALIYPSVTLADHFDPLECAQRLGPDASLDAVLAEVERRARELLEPIIAKHTSRLAQDERWYWAAPFLLDRRRGDVLRFVDGWSRLLQEDEGDHGAEGGSHFEAHVKEARQLLADPGGLGPPPPDLARVVALMALAAPGVCALRALGRALPPDGVLNALLEPAATIAWGFRSLFNLPESICLLRDPSESEPYWKRVLEYSAGGNLQAVLDEYFHVVRSLNGSRSEKELAADVASVLALRTNVIECDELHPRSAENPLERRRLRCRFAMRLSDEDPAADGSQEKTRASHVRAAFNSPFRPFVLATTSIGQEGLDFHLYCHRLFHWNLPPNPVDLEQREGRVHRFKGHVIRRNLAERYGVAASVGCRDPWQSVFARARADRPHESELFPFWVCEGSAKIERHVPAFELSREEPRLEALKRAVALYRMAFGQPRQQELVELLLERVDAGKLDELLKYRIDVSPSVVP